MKLKRSSIFIFSIIVILLFVFCKTNNNEISIEERLIQAKNNILNLDSYNSDMGINFNAFITNKDEKLFMDFQGAIIRETFLQPDLKIKGNINLNLESNDAEDSVKKDFYVSKDNDKYLFYFYDDNNWYNFPIVYSEVFKYDELKDMLDTIDKIEDLKEIGKELFDEKEVTIIEGFIGTEKFKDNVNKIIPIFNIKSNKYIEKIFDDIGKQKITIWLDNNNYPIKYNIDLSDLVNNFFDNIIALSEKLDLELFNSEFSNLGIFDIDFKAEELSFYNEITNINNVEDFELPQTIN